MEKHCMIIKNIVFNQIKKIKQVLKERRVNKWWQFYFGVNYPFKGTFTQQKCKCFFSYVFGKVENNTFYTEWIAKMLFSVCQTSRGRCLYANKHYTSYIVRSKQDISPSDGHFRSENNHGHHPEVLFQTGHFEGPFKIKNFEGYNWCTLQDPMIICAGMLPGGKSTLNSKRIIPMP